MRGIGDVNKGNIKWERALIVTDMRERSKSYKYIGAVLGIGGPTAKRIHLWVLQKQRVAEELANVYTRR